MYQIQIVRSGEFSKEQIDELNSSFAFLYGCSQEEAGNAMQTVLHLESFLFQDIRERSAAESVLERLRGKGIQCRLDGEELSDHTEQTVSRSSVQEEQAVFCTKCGNRISEGDAFCNKCGTPVDDKTETRAGKINGPSVLKKKWEKITAGKKITPLTVCKALGKCVKDIIVNILVLIGVLTALAVLSPDGCADVLDDLYFLRLDLEVEHLICESKYTLEDFAKREYLGRMGEDMYGDTNIRIGAEYGDYVDTIELTSRKYHFRNCRVGDIITVETETKLEKAGYEKVLSAGNETAFAKYDEHKHLYRLMILEADDHNRIEKINVMTFEGDLHSILGRRTGQCIA